MAPATASTFTRRARSWTIAGLLVGAVVAFWASGLGEAISFEALARERDGLRAWVESYPVLAPLALGAIYAVATVLSLPIASVLTVGAGFLLGTALASVVVVCAATVGATGLFLLARSAFGGRWRERVQGWLAKLDDGFHDNAFQYLLVLRLIPTVPFFVLNILPAFAGVSLRAYIAATFIGILPATVVYCSIGAGFDEVIARGEQPDLSILTDASVLLPLAGLAALAAVPLAYRRWRAYQNAQVEPTASPSA